MNRLNGYILSILVISCCLAMSASASKMVTLEVDTPPDIDPEYYRRIAVLPFASNAEEYYVGVITARKLFEEIENTDLFLVEDRDTVFRIADEINYDPTSREDALSIGKELGADAVIFGKVRFVTETYTPTGHTSNEFYTVEKTAAPPIEYGHTNLNKHLNLDVYFKASVVLRVLDVDTGRLMRRREFEVTHSEIYDEADLPLSDDETAEIVKSLMEEVAEEYAKTLSSHKVEEERYIVE